MIGTLDVTNGDFMTPAISLSESALRANVALLQRFCAAHGMKLAPHIKTTMSPEIVRAQLAAGAWATTVANVYQAAAMMDVSNRFLIANQVQDVRAIDFMGAIRDDNPDVEMMCWVDSVDGVCRMDAVLNARGQRHAVPVLVEVGLAGGRAGVRTLADAQHVAAAVSASSHLHLVGVCAFEGVIHSAEEVTRFLEFVAEVAFELSTASSEDTFIVSAGGTSYLEAVADELATRWADDSQMMVVLRSGCYVAYDSGVYARERRGLALAFAPAVHVWSTVVSRPEPELAILDFGKRETGTDCGFPTVEFRIPSGRGEVMAPPAGRIIAMNDQHTYFHLASGDPRGLAVGDVLGCGISHPCTTFDKWSVLPVVDDAWRLAGLVTTRF
ncbi:alanine racemase [Mycobacterium aquaticum]|uniref:alanine racemase n=1 Tax=Mycobacterium aquaticum TaxID=1927124 RepID=UPI0009F41EEA|nr:alanine racemase [Mycobacterium aquaticum]